MDKQMSVTLNLTRHLRPHSIRTLKKGPLYQSLLQQQEASSQLIYWMEHFEGFRPLLGICLLALSSKSMD